MVKIFVGNVPDSASGDDLRELFAKYGRVTESDVVGGKGFGFVHMETQDAADSAIAGLNGTDLKGRNLNVELSTGKPKSGGSQIARRGGGNYGRGGGGPRRDYGGPPRRDYGPPRRDYGPPRDFRSDYGPPRAYDPYGRPPPPADPYDRNGYYAPREAPRGYPAAPDPYRRQDPYRDAYGRPADPYRDPYAQGRRMSPPAYSTYARRTPPAPAGYYGSMAAPRARSPPRAAPRGAYPPDPYERR